MSPTCRLAKASSCIRSYPVDSVAHDQGEPVELLRDSYYFRRYFDTIGDNPYLQDP